VSGDNANATVQARGLQAPPVQQAKLSYSAPSDDASGDVEVRDERGRVERGATARAQQAQARQEAVPGEEPEVEASAPDERGAFGQRTGGDAAGAGNRAQRRAAKKSS